ncbi:unnamed protein product [Amaranthus hypochondriacus]
MGLGWDHEKKTISASEEWWAKKSEENIHFKAFQEEGIEPELESKMEQLFGVSVAQGVLKFTPAQCENDTGYIPSPPNLKVSNTSHEYDDVWSGSNAFDNSQTNKDWQEVWNDYNSTPSPVPSPQRIEQEVGKRGSKRVSETKAYVSNKSSKSESF